MLSHSTSSCWQQKCHWCGSLPLMGTSAGGGLIGTCSEKSLESLHPHIQHPRDYNIPKYSRPPATMLYSRISSSLKKRWVVEYFFFKKKEVFRGQTLKLQVTCSFKETPSLHGRWHHDGMKSRAGGVGRVLHDMMVHLDCRIDWSGIN